MKLADKIVRLLEGTWSLPDTVKSAEKLLKLMSKPLPAGKATDKLYKLTGDDDLFDNIDSLDKKEDARPLVIAFINKLLKDIKSDALILKDPFDLKAIAILKKVVKIKV